MTGERTALIALAVLLLAVTGLLGYVIYLVAELARLVRWLIYGSDSTDQGRSHMAFTRPRLFIIAALVCFIVLFLLAIDALSGGNTLVWLAAGLAFFTAAHLP